MNVTFSLGHKRFIIADYVFFLLIFILMGILRPDLIMISAYGLLFIYLFITRRKFAFYHLGVASFISLIWVLFANSEYGYNQKMLTLFGLNTYPLFAWATGLFVSYLIYAHWQEILQYKTFWKKLLLYAIFYWPILIFVETTAYHFLNVLNVAASSYPGLPFCDCIHAPRWMQTVYFILGPLYFSLCSLLGLEHKPFKKKKSRK